MALRLHEAVDLSAEERLELDRLPPIEGWHPGLDPGEGKRALLCRMKELAGERAGDKAQTRAQSDTGERDVGDRSIEDGRACDGLRACAARSAEAPLPVPSAAAARPM